MIKLYIFFMLIRVLPVYAFVKLSKNRSLIYEDLERWSSILSLKYGLRKGLWTLAHLLLFFREFRNVLIYRFGKKTIYSVITSVLFPPLNTLFIGGEEIGGGLYIQHGFATIIAARKIGRNCWINQQVTIGYNRYDAPVIGDNVTVYAGAKIIGDVTVGNNVVVGANCVVCKNVVDDVVVGGVPAKILKRNK